MRGPFVFLLSLAAVTGAAIGLFLPIHRERLALETSILEREATESAGRRPDHPPEIAALTTALGGPRAEAEVAADARALALDYAPIDLIEVKNATVAFPAAWKDVPALLARLTRGRGPILRSFSADPTEDPERCRITLEVAPVPNGFEAR